MPSRQKQQRTVADFNLAQNLSLPFLQKYSRLGWLDASKERQRASESLERLEVVCQSPEDNIGTLSGGNQQKVVVARWLAEASRLLVLDEPFQGVDIQARRDIGNQLRNSASSRATLVLVSEIDEALEVADRIVVLAEHSVVGEHPNQAIDMDLLLAEVASASQSDQVGTASHP